MMTVEESVDWLKKTGNLPNGISDLGRDVLKVMTHSVGNVYNFMLFCGKINWENNHHILIPFRYSLSTCDSAILTRLVVHSFDNHLRLNISPRHYLFINLRFHKRNPSSEDNDPMTNILPLDEMVEKVRLGLA